MAKARTTALARTDSRALEEIISTGRPSLLSAPVDGLVEGGVPIQVNGHCVGAVGVSGVASHQDAQVARAGVAALTR